jgi:hypothetical protein
MKEYLAVLLIEWIKNWAKIILELEVGALI